MGSQESRTQLKQLSTHGHLKPTLSCMSLPLCARMVLSVCVCVCVYRLKVNGLQRNGLWGLDPLDGGMNSLPGATGRLGPFGSLPESLLQDLFQNLVYQALWLQGGSLLASPGSAPVCLGSAEL